MTFFCTQVKKSSDDDTIPGLPAGPKNRSSPFEKCLGRKGKPEPGGIVQGSSGEKLAFRVKGYGPYGAAVLHWLPYRFPSAGPPKPCGAVSRSGGKKPAPAIESNGPNRTAVLHRRAD